ncbi:Uncharacterised protein [uncultured archaeon]|nr:Uncharacterised protein [uncultured archaeon]
MSFNKTLPWSVVIMNNIRCGFEITIGTVVLIILLQTVGTSTPITGEDVISRYTGGDGIVQRDGAVLAVTDYFSGAITKPEAIAVVMAYFSWPAITPVPTVTSTPTPIANNTFTPTPTVTPDIGNIYAWSNPAGGRIYVDGNYNLTFRVS